MSDPNIDIDILAASLVSIARSVSQRCSEDTSFPSLTVSLLGPVNHLKKREEPPKAGPPPFLGAVFASFVNPAREPLLGERESVEAPSHRPIQYCIFVLTMESTSVSLLNEVCMSESWSFGLL